LALHPVFLKPIMHSVRVLQECFTLAYGSVPRLDFPQDLLIASASIDLQALKHNNASLGLENGEIKCAKSNLSFGGIVCLS
jgi:hypothetical protein